MQQIFLWYCGMDISKLWFDVVLINKRTYSPRKRFPKQRFLNNQSGFQQFISWLKHQGVEELTSVLVGMEHTGVYTESLCDFMELHYNQITYTLIPAAYIQRAVGYIKRDKSDLIDARDIARYLYRFTDEIRVQTLSSSTIRTLKALWALQQRLKNIKHMLSVPAKELTSYGHPEIAEIINFHNDPLVLGAKQKREEIIQKMIDVVHDDASTKRNYNLLISVPGIGKLIAIYLIICTHNFVRFNKAKPLCCYAGIAPFGKQSGISVHGNTKVHHTADKTLKTLLTNGARAALQTCSEYRLFYERQLRPHERKQKPNDKANDGRVINILRNKMIHRAISVINRGEPYINITAYHQVKKQKKQKKNI